MLVTLKQYRSCLITAVLLNVLAAQQYVDIYILSFHFFLHYIFYLI